MYICVYMCIYVYIYTYKYISNGDHTCHMSEHLSDRACKTCVLMTCAACQNSM